MNKKRKEQIKAALVSRFKGLLDDHGDEVFEDYREAFVQHDSEKPFVFQIGFAGKLSLSGPEHKVGGKIRWNIPKSYDAVDIVLDDNDMFDAELGEVKEDVAKASGKHRAAYVIDLEPSKVDGGEQKQIEYEVAKPEACAFYDPAGKAAGGAPLFVYSRKSGDDGFGIGYRRNRHGRIRNFSAYGIPASFPDREEAQATLTYVAVNHGWAPCDVPAEEATGTEGEKSD